jgi:hypothetical protein
VIAEYNRFCHLVQRYAAIQCNGMLPLSATFLLPPSVQNLIHAEGVRWHGAQFDKDVVGVRRWESKVRFADDPTVK